MKHISVKKQLIKNKIKNFKHDDHVLNEVYKILNRDLFHEKKILQNLKLYNSSFELVNEEDVDEMGVFGISSIKETAIQYRLKFLDSQHYKKEIPYEAILKIKDLNIRHKKNIKNFKILAPSDNFKEGGKDESLILFAPTNHGNYFIIHNWGSDLNWYRKIIAWPMKRFENLLTTVASFSLLLAVCLPTRLIWLPENADYWGMYRLGAFMHILIFNMGVTAYFTFALGKNFSSNSWNQYQDFH